MGQAYRVNSWHGGYFKTGDNVCARAEFVESEGAIVEDRGRAMTFRKANASKRKVRNGKFETKTGVASWFFFHFYLSKWAIARAALENETSAQRFKNVFANSREKNISMACFHLFNCLSVCWL